MEKLKAFFDNGLPHWYYQTWFISLLFVLWFLVLPLFPAAILLVLQQRELKALYNSKETMDAADQYEERILEWAEGYKHVLEERRAILEKQQEDLIDQTKKRATFLLQDDYSAYVEKCQKLRQDAEEYQQKVVAEADQYKNRIMEEADSYYRLKKEKYDFDINVLESNILHQKEEAQKRIDEYIRTWEKIRLFTESQYSAICSSVEDILFTIDHLDDGHDFEYYLASMLQTIGYENVQVTKASGDMGADVLAEKDQIRYAIQCKKYRNPVDTTAVQQTISGLQYYHCHIGIVVTNSTFTTGAQELARETQVVLWDRSYLEKIVFAYARHQYIEEYGNELLE